MIQKTTVDGSALAYIHTRGQQTAPSLLYLCGFRSDMEGTKALACEQWARERGLEFLRFDYFGHGRSEGELTDGDISRWLADAAHFLHQLKGPVWVIGSSLGGWLALRLAMLHPDRITQLLLIAPAPDFTEDLMWDVFPPALQTQILETGVYYHETPYGVNPYPITKRLIEDGRKHLILRDKIPVKIPVTILHGMNDRDVPWERSIRLCEQLDSKNVQLHLIKDGDHRLSRPGDLQKIAGALEQMKLIFS